MAAMAEFLNRRAVLAVVVLAAGIVIAVLASNSAKDETQRRVARETTELSAAAKRERARVAKLQAPHFEHGPPRPPSRGAQAALIGELERSITRDAQRRRRDDDLHRRIRDTVCEPFVRPSVENPPQPPVDSTAAGYECVAVTSRIPASSRTEAAISGFPYWGRINFRTGAFVWCKINPRPAEHGTFAELAFVPLAHECDLLKPPRTGS
jgi:hypothetical protein